MRRARLAHTGARPLYYQGHVAVDHEGETRATGSTARRATQMFLVGIIGVSFVGFVVGLRQPVPTYDPRAAERPQADAGERTSIAAVPYREFDRRAHGPNRDWHNRLADLTQPEVDLFAAVHTSEDARARWLQARASRRAFDGAPPTVPHPIDQDSAASCIACHGEGLSIRGVSAPKISHEFMANCLQCHVEQQAHALEPEPAVATSFEGLAAPGRGSRAWPGAPPTIPHATFMREDCASCHGARGASPLRTSHPWQVSCTQCHAPSATLDQAVFDDDAAFLTPLPVWAPSRAAQPR